MNIKILLFGALILCLGLTSCIREEDLSSSPQCDITSVRQRWLEQQPSGLILGTPVIKQSQPASVTFFVSKKGDNVKALNPQFTVSEGATLFVREKGALIPFDSLKKYDFNAPKIYSVKSANQHFIKDYKVEFTVPLPIDSCLFDAYGYDSDQHNYMVLLQRQEDGSLSNHIWASGNGGYRMTGMAKAAVDYPTSFQKDTITGKMAACLVTKSNGFFGMMTRPKMPIAAGNLFIGDFQLSKAMKNPMGATRFGLQIAKGEPVSLSGTYRYTSGKEFTDRDKQVIPNQRDTADIYAVLYEVDPNNFVPLDGENILTSERIVMMARIDNPGEPQTWKSFNEPFRLMPGKQFSRERLENNGYAYTIVMTSSRRGAYFEGAVGSTLWVGKIKTTWK